MDVTRCYLCRPILIGVCHDGSDRREEGVHRFLRRFVLWRVGLRWYLFVFVGIPVIALLSVVVIACRGIVSRACALAPYVRARYLCLRTVPWRSAWRRAWVARVCAAPAAVDARSSGEPDPRSPLGIVAPAPVLDALE